MNEAAENYVDNSARKPRTKQRGGLFITDAELIEKLKVPPKIAREAIAELDRRHSTTRFPQKQPLWGNRRYWPAVEAYLERHFGLNLPSNGGTPK
jgi:hypothetical protein